MNGIGFYSRFASRVAETREQLYDLLMELKASGKSIAAYGASAKGCVLLNFCGLNTKTINFVVDNIPLKIGRYMPGVHIPVYHPTSLVELMPDYVLVLAWNVADEIVSQETAYHSQGGRFIIPLPQLHVI